ncbi:MAG TPA: cupin domain-containing protein [Chloroflexota bacterium]|nr:cupin domain-containing protein [Chloroflexota bacterium]
MATQTEVEATVFTLKRAPVLSAGRFDTIVARSNDLIARIKVYAEGGENALHTHLHEDHVFLVLAGQATFHLGRAERQVVVNRFEGVMLPAGAYYYFTSTGDENLVMFRVGTTTRAAEGERLGPDGLPLPGHSAKNKHVEGVPVEGKFFGI